MSRDIYFTAANVINGRATCATGAKIPQYTDVNWADSEVIPSGTAYATLQKYESLFIYHGGDNGSGNWEH